ncbi:MAG: hypothetical protein L0Y44_13070, partial [Phycisphaerales bacterium]|nr:hypothetical protein [Phycisphaerales bacterium]
DAGAATSSFHNCIFWWSGLDDSALIRLDDVDDAVEFRHCNIRGGLVAITGAAEPTVYANNFNQDPMFVGGDPFEYRVAYLSPCLNSGDPGLLPQDEFDLDDDNNFVEPIPFDLAGNARQINASMCVDVGAYENTVAETCAGDVTGPDDLPDGFINVADLLYVIVSWSTVGGVADIAPAPCGDGVVGVQDLLAAISGWGECGGIAGGMPQSVQDCMDMCSAEWPTGSQTWGDCVDKCVEGLCAAEIIDCD